MAPPELSLRYMSSTATASFRSTRATDARQAVIRITEIAEAIDLVDVSRNDVADVEEAIAKGAHSVAADRRAQPEADRLVRAAGLDSVLDHCVKIEHARIFGGLHWAGVNTGIVSARRPV
jgi:hypothetical protein